MQRIENGEEVLTRQKGFSLIELLIVVAIILIIAAIAIPNLLRARMAANESSAVGSVRTINTAEIAYNTAYSSVGYALNLLALGGSIGASCTPSSTSACLIDSVLANDGNPIGSGKSGYNFQFGGGTTDSSGVVIQYEIIAVPLTQGSTGVRSFCSVEDAVVRVQPSGASPGAYAGCAALSPLNQ
jgi:type IV pilus assembly protein PilA